MKLKDQVTSNLANNLAMYDEDLRADLCFPLDPLIQDILHQLNVVLA